MTMYKVELQEGDGGPVTVEAGSIRTDANWVFFNQGVQGDATTLAAVFPRERVVSVVAEKG